MTSQTKFKTETLAIFALTLISLAGIVGGVIVAYLGSPVGAIIAVVTGSVGGIVAIVLRVNQNGENHEP